jgi:Ca2+-binding RTX toxin-like protein
MKSGNASLTVAYGATVNAGVSDVQNVTLSGVTNSTTNLTIAGVETVNITTSGIKSTVNNLAFDKATTLNISGDQNLTVAGTVPVTAGTIDASGLTGKLSMTANPTPASASLTGGSNNDVITVTGTKLTATTTYDGGAGVDTLVLLAAADWNVLTYANVTNFEVLGTAVRETFDFSKLDGGVAVLSAAANGANSVTFTNMPSSSTGTISGTEGMDLLLAQDSASDDATITIDGGVAASSGVTVVDAIALAEYETVTINSASTSDNNINIESGQMTSLTVAGSQGITISITNATTLKVIDGSGIVDVAGTGLTIDQNPSVAAAGGVTITGTDAGLDNLLGGAGGDTISGGGVADSLSGAAGADTLNGGGGNDLIIGGAGIDTLNGGAGNDNFVVVTTADFTSLASAETIVGGDGTDTLIFGGASTLATAAHAVASDGTAYTIAATDLHNVDVEQIKSFEDGTFTLTVDDIFFTNSGQTSLIIDNSTAAGDMTVSGSTLSAANSLDIRSNGGATTDTFTGGKGDDIFRFDTTNAAGLATGDILAGGGGTDTVAVTLTADNMTAVANTNGMSRIEKITFAGSGTLTANLAINNATFVTETVGGALITVVGEVDASGMVGTGALTFNGALETDSKMTITGGRGADIITGGSKVDTISGGYGADTITGGPGIDILSGGAGNDIFTVVTKANAFLLTNAETIDGGTGTDTINITDAGGVGVTAADLINMSSIEMIEFNGAGDDSIVLSDQVFTNNGATSIKIENSAAGTMGVNAAGVSAVNSVNYQYDAASGNIAIVDTFTGGSGNDTITFTDGRQWTSTDIINGGAGVDTVVVQLGIAAGANLAAGTQSTLSNIENITLVQASTNTVDAAITTADTNFVGVDATINGAGVPGVLTINAAAETDSNLTINGGTGNDILTGGTNPTKVDTITGGLGDDTITGGRGVDILTGGAGADIFAYTATNQSNTSTSDSIKDFVPGTDKISITVDLSTKTTALVYDNSLTAAKADVSAAQASLTGVAGQMLYVTDENALYINDNSDNLLTSLDYKIGVNPAATATATIAAADIAIKITGAAASTNTITTGSGADIIIGGSAGDIIISGAGNDIIITGAGVDIINGGAGNDTITTTDDADTITPGAGVDILIITDTDAIDTIILDTAALGTDTGAVGSVDIDVVTGFVLATGKDTLQLSVSALEAIGGVIDLVLVGNAAASVADDADTVLMAGGTNATNLNSTVTANYLEVLDGGVEGGALETLLEINGANELTAKGQFEIGDAFLVLSDNAIDTSLFLIRVNAQTADGATFAVGALTAIELISLVGVADAAISHADNIDFVA